MKCITLILIGLLGLAANAQTGRADALMKELKDQTSERILVVSHRGDWRNAPENSLQAISNCIDMGVDMVEIDLKKTKDGHLILMHDKTIDRTTTGKGKPEDYTLTELKELWLRNGAGHKTDHKVATLEEAMSLAKDKILVNIDKGYDYFDEVYEVLCKTETLGQCVIKAGKPYGEVKAENPVALEKMIFMPVINLNKEEAAKTVEEYRQQYGPLLYEFVFDTVTPEVLSLIHATNDSGAKVFINSLWPELCGGHHDDMAVEKGDKPGSWGWLIDHGTKLIQTDRPQALIEYLNNTH